MARYVIGVDLGGTKVEACLMDSGRNILSRCRTASEPALGQARVAGNIARVVAEAAAGRRFEAVGMGTPGTYLPALDQLFGVPHTPVYEIPGFMGSVRSGFDVPLLIDNDANCLALAEYFASCAGKYRFVLAVILGTGMGYGLILDGRLYRGAIGGAGEIGHTTIDYRGRVCECGRRGCAEAYLSGSSLSRRFREASGETLDVPAIYERYLLGDPVAQALFEESCRMMGEVFANTVNAFDLEAIVLGGGVSNLPLWYEKVPQYLNRSLFGPPRGGVPILKAALGDSAGVAGAAYLALRQLGLMDF
jgi:predicted NBD/HSP70 family sugar kinase